jgi:hypothetical protein
VLKSSESSPSACGTSAGFPGLAGFAGEGSGLATGALPGTGLLSAFFHRSLAQPNSEKTTKNYPPPGESAMQISISLYHFARYSATLDVGDQV